jgi:hypothetical protein
VRTLKDPRAWTIEAPPWAEGLVELGRRLRKGGKFGEADGWLVMEALRDGVKRGELAELVGMPPNSLYLRMGGWVMKWGRGHFPDRHCWKKREETQWQKKWNRLAKQHGARNGRVEWSG